MIGLLRGVAAAIGAEAALIEVGGVGYVAQAGARTLARLQVGAETTLFVETVVREDSIKLYGFLAEDERAWFVELQSVQGVGARVALAILDALGPQDLADAIALQDKAALVRANGVGPKLGARIVQELAGRQPPRGFLAQASLVSAPERAAVPPNSGARAETISALINLGIDQASAQRAAAAAVKALGAEAETSALIRAALKEIQP